MTPRRIPGLIAAISLALLSLTGCSRDAAPDSASLNSTRAGIVHHLDDQVLPFWTSPRFSRPEHGGYLPYLDAELRFTGKTERHVIPMLRLLYVHAVAISRTGDPARKSRLQDQFRERFEFLLDRYLDRERGGFYTRMDAADRPDGSPKETRAQIHAVYFLSQIGLLTGHKPSIELARSIDALVEERALDREHGGYLPYLELDPEHPLNQVKPLGIQMHMMLALVHLQRLSPEPRHASRIEALSGILTSRYTIPGSGGLIYNALSRDWREIEPDGSLNSVTVYGHGAELIWYLLEATGDQGLDLDGLTPWLVKATDALLESGMNREGAVYFTGDYRGRAIKTRVLRWPPAESMVAFLRMYELTGDRRYWSAFRKVRDWTFRYLIVDDSGTWIASASDRGIPRVTIRSGGSWQSGFHTVRALLQCEAALTRLEDT